MQLEVLKMLINPYNKESLSFKWENGKEFLVDLSGNRIPIYRSIPDFLSLENTSGLNLKYQRFYDRISSLNNISEIIYSCFYDLKKLRRKWMADVEVKETWNVLETSVGTGWNFKMLPAGANYFGVDISGGMLRQAQKNERKWQIPMYLFKANAEYLPFADNVFDSVFHAGGINFFNDKKRAIDEMIRVAKPGTRIVIIDETEKRIREQYQRMPLIKKYFVAADINAAQTAAPVDLIPLDVKELQLKLQDNGKMYQLSFRTPRFD